jgi:hypothetical protein
MESIKQILMRRDGMAEEEADELMGEAAQRYMIGDEDPEGLLEDLFGLELDYLLEFLEFAVGQYMMAEEDEEEEDEDEYAFPFEGDDVFPMAEVEGESNNG